MLPPFYYKPAKIYLTPKPLMPLSLLRHFVLVVVSSLSNQSNRIFICPQMFQIHFAIIWDKWKQTIDWYENFNGKKIEQQQYIMTDVHMHECKTLV